MSHDPRTVRIALAQVNTVVGDLRGNVELMAAALEAVAPLRPDLVAFPELAVTGYPPEDLLGYRPFLDRARQATSDIAARFPDPWIVLGVPWRDEEGGGDLWNAAALLHGGSIRHIYAKCTLPNYGVFDEKRYFRPGRAAPVYRWRGIRLAVNICEDIWVPAGVPALQSAGKADLMVNLSSSPYHRGKVLERHSLVRHRAVQHGVVLAYVNLVGGQDELVFDGGSVVADRHGSVVARGRLFAPDLVVVDVEIDGARGADRLPSPEAIAAVADFKQPRYEDIDEIEDDLRLVEIDLENGSPVARLETPPQIPPRDGIHVALSDEEEVYAALVLGTRDYVTKNGFTDVVIGLSGGIDSALTAVIACDALGRERVHGLTMPGPYTSASSLGGARELAGALRVGLEEIAIEGVLRSYLAHLGPVLGDAVRGIAEENLQARIRGNLLMALSNARGWLVLTTGNKSELAVGYCTLYGDMAGGFAVIKDVPKELVYALAAWRNSQTGGPGPIPSDTMTRPPSAELRPDQKDTDSLPPYPILDPILEARIEREEPIATVIARGWDADVARGVYRSIDRNEYKRRQAPPGIKITPRAFGRDRRYPITNRFDAAE